MHSSGSLLYTILNRVRSFLDEPTLDAKFSNDYMVRHVLIPEMANIISMLTDVRGNPVVIQQSLSLTTSGEYYELPPSIGKVYRLAKMDSEKNIVAEIPFRTPQNSEDAGWWLEGRELHVRPLPGSVVTDYSLWYTPSGNIVPHYSAAGGTMNIPGNQLTLDLTPDLGDLDQREDAYVGCILRVWTHAAPDKVAETVITSYDINETTDTATVDLREALAAPFLTSDVKYEIVPYFMDQIWQAVSLSCAVNLGVSRNISEKQMAFLQGQLKSTLQAISQTFDPLSNETVYRPEQSILHNITGKVKRKLSDDLQKDLTDDQIINDAVIPELKKLLSIANDDPDSAVLMEQAFTTTSGEEHYLLNPNISRIVRVAKKSTSDTGLLPYEEVRKRDEKDPYGHGWGVQGNRLSILPTPDSADTLYVWYVPGGDLNPHFAIDGYLLNSTVLKLTTGNLFSSLLGEIDRRHGAYIGSMVRVTSSLGSVDERVITAHSADDTAGLGRTHQGQITVDEDFTGTFSRDCTYEIIPSWWTNFEAAMVDASVISLAHKEKEVSEARLATLMQTYQSSLKSMQAELKKSRVNWGVTSRRNSMLHNILEKVQQTLSNAAPDLDYSPDFIIRQGLNNELGNVISRLNNTRSDPYYCKFEITTVKDQQYYPLPAGIGEIARLVEVDDNGRITRDLIPRGDYSWSGPGWSVQNGMISFRPYPSSATTYELWYIPNGSSWPHYAEDGALSEDRDVLTLTTGEWGSQLLGDIDHRDGAYVGYTLRIVGGAAPFDTEIGAGVIEERTITSHDPSSGTVTVERPFSDNIATGTGKKYEIVPMYLQSINEAVVSGTIANLAAGSKSLTERQQKTLYVNYRSAMKTAGDNLSNMQGRVPKHFSRSTIDNEGNWDIIR